jgi:hypothetical protein
MSRNFCKSSWCLKRFLLVALISLFMPVVANAVSCKIAIVGGGIAGMHTLYKLTLPKAQGGGGQQKDDVCLFEANNYFGGRVKDIPAPGKEAANAPVPQGFGLGALRIMDGPAVMFKLAEELGIKGEAVDYGPNRVFARGKKSEHWTDSFLRIPQLYATSVPDSQFPDDQNFYPVDTKSYPNKATAWTCGGQGGPGRGAYYYPGCYLDAYTHAILNPKYLSGLTTLDNKTWLMSNNFLKPEGFQYLTDSFRFRGDFQYNVDAKSYKDFLTEDWDACCTPTYPVGGMSSFILAMYESAKKYTDNIFPSRPVSKITKNDRTGTFTISFPLELNLADVSGIDSVIIAVPPSGLNKIVGAVSTDIKANARYNALVAVPVVSVNNWWNDINGQPWWKYTASEAKDLAGNPLSGVYGLPLDRAWSTPNGIPKQVMTFNFIEMPHSPFQISQKATRSVYNDDKNTIDSWVKAWGTGGVQGEKAVNSKIVAELNLVFPELAKNMGRQLSAADISKTAFIKWPDAWYWLKAPVPVVDGKLLTNGDVAVWAVKPLGNAKVSLASDAYNPSRTTWTEGAVKSSINSLNYNYGPNGRIAQLFDKDLPCYSVAAVDGVLTYIPFNKDGVFNATCQP